MDGPDELYPDRIGFPVTCIGAGGIGSSIIPMFVRAGVQKLSIWDFDVVAPVNLQMQNFDAKDLGKLKAKVLARRAKQINPNIKVYAKIKRFTQYCPLDGIVVGAVDSMEKGREQIFAAVKKSSSVELLVDGRFTRKGDFIDLYFIDPRSEEEMENYKGWLFPDSEAFSTPRSDSMTSHVPYILSGLMGEVLAVWAKDRSHPWKVIYDAGSHSAERYYASGSN